MSNYKSNLQSNNETLSANNLDLQSLIEQANNLPDAGDIELPILTNKGTAADVLMGKQLIDQDGNIVTGKIPINTSSNLIATAGAVVVPNGYYADLTIKAVDTATQATPNISINSTGEITASATQSAGYVKAGTKTSTKQLTTQASKTVTPNESSQTAVASGVYTTGAVTVAAIPDGYMVDNEIVAQDNLISQIAAALQGKAAGSGGKIMLGSFEVTDNGMWSPGVNEYVLSSDELDLTKAKIFAVITTDGASNGGGIHALWFRQGLNSEFTYFMGLVGGSGSKPTQIATNNSVLGINSVTVYGNISYPERCYFITVS